MLSISDRCGSPPRPCAALIGFLSSSANTYVTGQTILQDGGRLSALPTVDQQ
jgi:NAD(P)-dependent dehydrogenase (short-subunit alcohol dehydrogenase family)